MPERLSIPIPKYVVYDPRFQGRQTLPPEEVASSPEYQEYIARIRKKDAGVSTPTFDLSMLQETPEELFESGTLGVGSLKPYLPYILAVIAGIILFQLLKGRVK